MQGQDYWYRVTKGLVRNKETKFSRDARAEFSEIKNDVDFWNWFSKLESYQPNLINSQPMVVTLLDLGRSNATRGVFGQDQRTISETRPFALLEDLVMMQIVGKIFAESVQQNNGTYLGIESGDMGKACFGAMPQFTNLDDNVERALMAVDDFEIRLMHEGSNGYKALITAEEVDRHIRNGTLPGLDAFTQNRFLQMSYGAERLLGKVSETGLDSRLQVSMGVGIGPNKCTITKIHQIIGGIDLTIPKIEINGIGALQAGRAEALAVNGKGAMVSPVTKDLYELDQERYLAEDLHEIRTKDGWIWGQTFRGIRIYNHPSFFGRLPENSYVVLSGQLNASKAIVGERAQRLKQIQVGYLRTIDIPEDERGRSVYHGDSLTNATLVGALGLEGLYPYGSQADTQEGIKLNEAIDLVLIRNIGRYNSGHTVLDTGFVPHDMKARRREEAENAYTALSNIKEFADTKIPEYARSAFLPFEANRDKFDEKVALGLQGIDIVEMWYELVSPRSHSFKTPHDEALKIINKVYGGSPVLEKFNRLLQDV